MLQNSRSNAELYCFMGIMVVSGSLTTVSNKMQQETDSLGKRYHHVWFVVFYMFLGKLLCGFLYLLLKIFKDNSTLLNKNAYLSDTQPTSISPFLLAIPMLCDFAGSTIQIFGLTMVPGSVYQIFRGSLVIFTALLSVFFLKAKLYIQHYLGILFVVLGLILVGLSMEYFSNERSNNFAMSQKDGDPVFGIFLVILGQFFSAGQYVIEEKLIKNSSCHPLKVVGIEGMWGTLVSFVVLTILNYVKCDPESELTQVICSENDSNEWRGEDLLFALRQLQNDGSLCCWAVAYLLSISVCNYTGITITKYVASSNRTMVDVMKNALVWSFFLMPFLDECIRESFSYLHLIGFLTLSLGTIIYNKLNKKND